jgi:hypothetical protein
MGFDLAETARTLTSQNGMSAYLRAIRLFEFQIWLFYPEEMGVVRDARLLAALKLLEHIEKRILQANNKKELSWHDLSNDSDYVEVFEQVFLRSGGWGAIRNIWSTKEFEEQVQITVGRSRVIAKILDFSYRFTMLKANDRRRAGVTMARSIVRKSPSYKYRRRLGTLKQRWSAYKTTAAFLYLLFIQKFHVMPPSISSSQFSKILLKQAADVEHLAEFFQAYRHVCEVLHIRGYNFPRINAVDGRPVQSLPYDPFPTDVEEAIKNYKSA